MLELILTILLSMGIQANSAEDVAKLDKSTMDAVYASEQYQSAKSSEKTDDGIVITDQIGGHN
ncbi:MAG: hypothetical protein RIQ89_800 [Bacteroidota bacterium]|jgi:hypothetical protein